MNVLVFHPFIASCIEGVRIKFIKINVEKGERINRMIQSDNFLYVFFSNF